MDYEKTPLNVAISVGDNMDPNLVLWSMIGAAVAFVITVALMVAMFCASCEIYRKAGVQKCWKALIPFYNVYVLCKIIWTKMSFNIYIGLLILSAVFYFLGVFCTPLLFIGLLVVLVLLFVYKLVLLYKLLKSFGHGIGWLIGLLLVCPLFWLMLAFGKSKCVSSK